MEYPHKIWLSMVQYLYLRILKVLLTEVNIYVRMVGYNISTLMGSKPIDQSKVYRAPNHLDFTHNRSQRSSYISYHGINDVHSNRNISCLPLLLAICSRAKAFNNIWMLQ
jgi:hypothetical protein